MRIVLALAGLMLLAAGGAEARCAGRNLFAELERTEPAAAAALQSEARAVANGEGRFWRIEKAAIAPSHLFGTFHVSDATERLPDGVWPALDGARVAVFEVTLDSERELKRRMATDPGFVMDPAAAPFADRMDPDDVERVVALFAARGINREVAEKLRPWMLISLVTFPPCQMREVARGARMLDAVLARHARARGIPEKGLERAVDALETLSGIPSGDLTRLLVAAGRLTAFEEDLFTTNLELYRAGRIALIARLNDWMADRHLPGLGMPAVNARLMRAVLDGRNARWMPALLEEVGRGNAFVAVGALHLVGEAGLVAALVRAGFTVTRLD